MSEDLLMSRQAGVQKALDELLVTDGFFLDEPITWVRRWGWKADTVDLVWKQADMVVNFYVIVPTLDTSKFDEGFTTIAVRGLGLLLGQTDSLIRSTTINNSFNKFCAQFQSALSWFDQLRSPSSCIDFINSQPNAQSLALQEGLRYLSSLPSTTDQVSFKRHPPKLKPSLDGYRRLFDVSSLTEEE